MSDEHPIQDLMTTALENIKDMVDVDTIIGEPIDSPDQLTIILPVSKVGFGFAAGGSEFETNGNSDRSSSDDSSEQLPFGGGAGGGVSITPIAFLVVRPDDIQIIHMNDQTHLMEKLIELAPQAITYAKNALNQQQSQRGQQSHQQEKNPPTTPE